MALSAQDAVETDLKRQVTALKGLHQYYNARDDAGSKKLAPKLKSVLDAADGYLAGGADPAEIARTANAALKEASRYSSAKAKEAQSVLKSMISLAGRLPQQEAGGDAATEESPAEHSGPEVVSTQPEADGASTEEAAATDAASSDAADGPRVRIADDSGRSGGSDRMLYLLFVVYLMAVAALGVFLSLAQKNHAKRLNARVDKLAERLENIEFASGGQDDFKNVKLNEVKKRIDALEQNMADFLERVEARNQESQQMLEKLAEGSITHAERMQGVDTKMAQLATLAQRVQALEQAGGLGKSTGKGSSGSAIALKGTTAEVSRTLTGLTDALGVLHEKTRMVALVKRIEAVTPALDKAKLTASLDLEDWNTLGRIIQLAFSSAYNENLQAAYASLMDAARSLNLMVEDTMNGRMAFSDFYAENVPVDAFMSEERFRAETLPEFRSAKEEIDTSPQLRESVSGTVLFTLQPTVILQQDGGRKVLQKGLYVVK